MLSWMPSRESWIHADCGFNDSCYAQRSLEKKLSRYLWNILLSERFDYLAGAGVGGGGAGGGGGRARGGGANMSGGGLNMMMWGG